MEITKEENKLKERKVSWAKLRRVDSLNLEAGRVSDNQSHNSQLTWKVTLSLAFQSLGIIYGDIGTSPLYVYASTFTEGIKNNDDILGVLSLIIYTIVIIPMVKYVFIVLWANDNGNAGWRAPGKHHACFFCFLHCVRCWWGLLHLAGRDAFMLFILILLCGPGGAFALYSLICRHMKVGLIPNQQPEDRELSNYRLEEPSSQLKRAEKIKSKLENSKSVRIFLVLVTIMGTSMVMGDGVLTPSISVLSAVSGISKSMGQGAVVGITIGILIALFSVQRFGTDKVGFSFAPIVLVWFSFIGGIGLYNLFKYDVGVLRAFNPKYIIDYFRRNGKQGWISLGGVFLCITGSEAMFADLGHFSVRAVQISFSCVTFPALLAAYSGQAAYLRKFPQNVANTFYDSIPDPLYWPTFVVAIAAAIIASQAMISGAFSILSQALNLGCFPRVRVVHTSVKHKGQVYIPEVNYMFMIACVIVCAAFRTTENISHAYGIAVVCDMMITTSLVTLIMLTIWKTKLWCVFLFPLIFGCTEALYLTAQLTKFPQGGFLPLVSAFFLTILMGTWHYVHKERYNFELENKISTEQVNELIKSSNVNRVPGIGLLYSELVQGIPPIFPHFIANVPSIHSVVVFVSIKSLPISRIAMEERFLFRQVGPREHRMFRCVVRYGYNDRIEEPEVFETQLVQHLEEFIRQEDLIVIREEVDHQEAHQGEVIEQVGALAASNETENARVKSDRSSNSHRIVPEQNQGISRASTDSACAATIQRGHGADEEVKFVERAREKGVVYLLGEAEVVAKPNSSFINKIVINYIYGFMRHNFRQGVKHMAIPRQRLLKVGMTYEI